jgi:hypothetical protein
MSPVDAVNVRLVIAKAMPLGTVVAAVQLFAADRTIGHRKDRLIGTVAVVRRPLEPKRTAGAFAFDSVVEPTLLFVAKPAANTARRDIT